MIQKITAQDRHFTDMNWLKTYWLFSFSNYFDAGNVDHGMLRVYNDDIVEPHTGFSTHPHEEMEIISIVLDGEMTHKDTMGNETVIRKNDVQRMTAGTGLFHSEQNDSNHPVHFHQIWIHPDKTGLTPSYDQKNFAPEQWKNKLTLLAGEDSSESVVALNTDASIYRSELDQENIVNYTAKPNRKLFIYVIDGSLTLNGENFETNDQARISDTQSLQITARSQTDFILIDIAPKPHSTK